MKNVLRDRAGFALPELLAYAGISRSIRPFRRAPHFAIGIVLENWERKTSYVHAAVMFIDARSDYRHQDYVKIFDGRVSEDRVEPLMDMLQHKRSIVFFRSREAIPADLLQALDLVVNVEPPDNRQVRGVIHWSYRTRVSPEQAEAVITSDWRRLRLAMTRGRPMSKVLDIMERMAQVGVSDKQTPAGETRQTGKALADIRLENMEGYGAAKEWGLELARDLEDWRTGTISWDDVDTGLLLSGPPGTGKTIYAKALAATCNVELVVSSFARWQARGHLNDFLKAMQASFQEARRNAPSIIFIDEIDAFGSRDSVSTQNESYDTKVINGLLEQLDGLEGREGVVVVAASNRPEKIDPAILRSGRLDRHIEIPLPDSAARAAIFRIYLHGAFDEASFHSFAELSSGVTGADIQKIARDARRMARRKRRPTGVADVLLHLPLPALVPPETVRVNAVHEIGHAVVGTVLGMDLVRVEVSSKILPTAAPQSVGRATFARRPWARRTKSYYLDEIAMGLAGMAAEQVMLSCHDDGVAGDEGDLRNVTRLAIRLERAFGMGNGLACLVDVSDEPVTGIVEKDRGLLRRVDRTLQQQLARAREIIKLHRPAFSKLVDDLVGSLELSGQDVRDMLDAGTHACFRQHPTDLPKHGSKLQACPKLPGLPGSSHESAV